MRLGLIASISVIVAGTALAGGNDPFAAYESSIDAQLTRILENQRSNAPAGPESREPAPASVAENSREAQNVLPGPVPAGQATALGRLQRLRPALERILEDEGVPKEFVAVVLVESGAQPDATSVRQARGLWQLMPDTARQYGAAVGSGRDERVDPERATRAAARYLRDLYSTFRNWPLALAAYNAGQHAVQSALLRSGAKTFWELRAGRALPEETRNYVPAVLSAMRLLGRARPDVPAADKRPVEQWVYATARPSD